MPTSAKCFVSKCNHRKSDRKCIFFTFPENVNRCKQWVRIVGVEDFVHLPISFLSKNRFVCRCHFTDSDFCSPQKKRLKRSAIPTEFETPVKPLNDDIIKEFPPKPTTGGITANVQLTDTANLIKTLPIFSSGDVIDDFEHHAVQFENPEHESSVITKIDDIDKAAENSLSKIKKYRLSVAVAKLTNKKISSDVTIPGEKITQGVNCLLNSIRLKKKEAVLTKLSQSVTCN